jgi:uncharacterized protein (DUF1330 family)
MSEAIVLVAHIFVTPGRGSEFEAFETAAASIIERYGGKVVRRLGRSYGHFLAEPDEVHIVTFPSRDAYDGYRRDPELATLAGLRDRAIRSTVVWEGMDLPPFGG